MFLKVRDEIQTGNLAIDGADRDHGVLEPVLKRGRRNDCRQSMQDDSHRPGQAPATSRAT